MIKAVVALVCNDKKELALQLRSAKDDAYPLHWDFSAGGGVHDGELEKDAVLREVHEELGVVLELKKFDEFCYKDVQLMVPTYTYNHANADDQTGVFYAQYRGDFSPSQKEVESVRFVDRETLRDMIMRGEKFHPELFFYAEKRLLKNPVMLDLL